jgi:hypothetical protein
MRVCPLVVEERTSWLTLARRGGREALQLFSPVLHDDEVLRCGVDARNHQEPLAVRRDVERARSVDADLRPREKLLRRAEL